MWSRVVGSVAALMALAACKGPIVGGPCSYETERFSATITSIDDVEVRLAGPEGEFALPHRYFAVDPSVGDAVEVEHSRITSGSCTPNIYSIVASETG